MFELTLLISECNHVIDSRRTFITALSHGRNRDIRLRATYQNVERTDFQVNLYSLLEIVNFDQHLDSN